MKYLFRTGGLVVCLLVSSTSVFAQSPAEDLIKNVLKSVETNDRQSFKGYVVSDQDIKSFVWPNLSGVLRSSMNVDQYLQTSAKSSDAGLAELLIKFGGKKVTLVKLMLPEPKKKGQGYQLFDGPLVTIRDEAGSESSTRIVGGLLERGGIYKVTTYYVSPTTR